MPIMEMSESIGLAFYHYDKYVENAKKRGETPLTMMQLLFGRK